MVNFRRTIEEKMFFSKKYFGIYYIKNLIMYLKFTFN